VRGGDVGLNDAEWIWMNLISALIHRNKRYVPVATRIMSSISAC